MRVKSTGMTRALLRSRTETKLLAQAAANKVAVSPNVTDAQVRARYAKDKSSYALPERRKIRHILVKDKALADQLYTQLESSDASFGELAKKYSDRQGQRGLGRRARRGQPQQSRQAVRRRRVHDTAGRRLDAGQIAVRLAPDRGRGARAARRHAAARRDAPAADPHAARAGRPPEEHREAVRRGSGRAEQDIQFAPGYGPPIASTQ